MIEHLDDVIRELGLIAFGALSGEASPTVPERVLTTMERVRPLVYAQKEDLSQQALAAWRDGRSTMDVTLDLPPEAADTLLEVLDIFEAVDAASEGDAALLLPPTGPDAAAFRRWFLTELAGAVQGPVGQDPTRQDPPG